VDRIPAALLAAGSAADVTGYTRGRGDQGMRRRVAELCRRPFYHLFLSLFFGILVCSPLAAGAQAAETLSAIASRIGQLAQRDLTSLQGRRIAAVDFLAELYKSNDFEPLWQEAGNRQALLQAIARSSEDGLTPADFHREAIRELTARSAAGPLDTQTQADFDIILGDALARLGYHLFYGKVNADQLDPDWNFSRPLLKRNPAEIVLTALRQSTLPRLLAELRLDHPYYLTLKAALRSHREIASSGGWSAIPSGPTLKSGMAGERVAALRHRLAASGDYDAAAISDPRVFDPPLEAAVRRFQVRHGLESDGVVGKVTLEELNLPVAARIDQIRVNMERARWVLRNLDDDFIVVNIAGFYLNLIRDGELAWHSPVIVGTPYRKTPVFTAPMRYLELNPTWTIPPTILREDLLPKVTADPGYLAANGFHLVDFQRQPVDAATVDWKSLDGKPFPYLIVQEPGPRNALGLIKFMLPNDHAVYLHDTPSRGLFKSAARSFSSGCIRVENPFELAAQLLSEQEDWTPARMAEVIDSKATTRVNLPQPLPVLLLYWTVDPDPSGNVRFYRDIYDRDVAVLKALNADHPDGQS
jgi:murein L,D-transpeptidase YcbB/YkuD